MKGLKKSLSNTMSSSPVGNKDDDNLQPMEGYVEQIGSIKPKDVKQYKQAAGTVLKELNEHTKHISEMEEQRRKENAHPHADGVTAQGWQSRERLVFYAIVVKCVLSGVIFPIFDVGSDIATAATHFRFDNVNWGLLTVLFILLPGFVCGLAIMIKGLKADRFSWPRLANYLIVLALMPVLYPLVVVLVNLYMVYLMIARRSREIVSIMGHDVKQFKSLEGFLEAGPQFVLQTYILLQGGGEPPDEGSSEAKRFVILAVSIVLSFLSLTKTGYNVNVPDPDEERQSMQYPDNAPRFKLTSILFHLVCVLFRVTCLALFFACFGAYTIVVMVAALAVNMALFYFSDASNTMTLLLGLVSIFMPNGYLLYNFAATFPVDLAFSDTRRFLALHMSLVTAMFSAAVITIAASSANEDDGWLIQHVSQHEDSILEEKAFTGSLCAGLLVAGVASVAACFLHWKVSIVPLYIPPAVEEVDAEQQEGRGWKERLQFWKKS